MSCESDFVIKKIKYVRVVVMRRNLFNSLSSFEPDQKIMKIYFVVQPDKFYLEGMSEIQSAVACGKKFTAFSFIFRVGKLKNL